MPLTSLWYLQLKRRGRKLFLTFQTRRKYISVCLLLYEVPQRISVSGITYVKVTTVEPLQWDINFPVATIIFLKSWSSKVLKHMLLLRLVSDLTVDTRTAHLIYLQLSTWIIIPLNLCSKLALWFITLILHSGHKRNHLKKPIFCKMLNLSRFFSFFQIKALVCWLSWKLSEKIEFVKKICNPFILTPEDENDGNSSSTSYKECFTIMTHFKAYSC